MIFKNIDHIGLACRNIEDGLRLYRDVMGFQVVHDTVVEHMKLHVIKLNINGVIIELLAPLDGEGVVSKFIETKGEGLHHVCFKVENLASSLKHMESMGFKSLWSQPKKGASGKFVNFFHPKQTGGVLIEITE
ncbi:MAG: methylmalonyl-CoA epimerase [Planctomycetes bacterium]|nr:methylmalonyl-CoA epimerase [Planctomycetota bacterium]